MGSGWLQRSPVGVFVLFAKKKSNTALKAGFLLLNVFLLVPFAGHVLNGFSYVSNRWIWVYGMLIAYIFVKIYPELFRLDIREKRKVFVMLLIYCGVALFGGGPHSEKHVRNASSGMFHCSDSFVRIYLCKKKKSLSDDERTSCSGNIF